MIENVLKSLTINVIEQLQNAAKIIGSECSSEEEKIHALDTIMNYIDDIDTAMDFCKIGGLFVLLPCLNSPYSEIRNKSALLLAELSQNNPYCQKELLELEVLPKLMNLLSEDDTVVAGLRSISCLVRGYEPCLNAFTEIGGLECLLGCLQSSHTEKVITRAAFFLNSLCTDFPEIRNNINKLRAVEIIIPLIQPQAEYNTCLETLLLVLCTLCENTLTVDISQYADFQGNLKEIIKLANNKPECKEIVEYCQTLIKLISDGKQQTENTDR